jgi:hypothetical protein
MNSPLLATEGAVPAEGLDAGVAAHYGDPVREQRAMDRDAGLIDRSNRGVVSIAGPDRLSWLHSLTTQHLDALAPGPTAQALVLSPNGHVEHHLTLTDDGTTTWIHVEPGTAPALVEFLDSMRFMLRVEVADVSASYAVMTQVSEETARDELVPRDELAGWAEATSLPLVGHGAWEARRVERRLARLGFETDHRTIPHEVGWIGVAVHLNKGCYRGQETVARVQNLGRPPRRLVFGYLDGTSDELPVPHTDIELDGRTVGFLGTARHHSELGPIALAVIKRNTADDARLTVAGMAIRTERVVDA